MCGYSVFSNYYDVLTCNINYLRQYSYYSDLLSKSEHKPGLLLDLASGTGSLSFEFAKNGVNVIALDSSVDMLSIAKQKSIENGLDVFFVCQEMQSFYLHENVDTIICSLDSINHLNSINDVESTFKHCYNALNKNGLLVFDVNTIYKHKKILANNTFVYDLDDVYCVWKNFFNEFDNRVDIVLDFFKRKENLYYRETESFSETAYKIEDLKNILNGINLNVLNIYNYMTFENYSEENEKVVFVCRKV